MAANLIAAGSHRATRGAGGRVKRPTSRIMYEGNSDQSRSGRVLSHSAAGKAAAASPLPRLQWRAPRPPVGNLNFQVRPAGDRLGARPVMTRWARPGMQRLVSSISQCPSPARGSQCELASHGRLGVAAGPPGGLRVGCVGPGRGRGGPTIGGPDPVFV